MDNQHRKITGYRELNPDEIMLINDIKALGQQAEELTEKLKTHITRQVIDAQRLKLQEVPSHTEQARLEHADPAWWLFEGKTEIQKGLMALTRAVAQPTSF